MRVLSTATMWLLMLSLPILLLGASLGGAANSLWLYKYGLHKYDVQQALADSGLHLSDTEIEEIYAGLISYYNSGQEYINFTVTKDSQASDLFTPEESIHFKDVKGLIRLDYRVLLGTLIYVLGYIVVNLFWRRRRYWRRLAWGVVSGSSLTLALMLILGLAIWLDFGQLFLQFHYLSFSNEFWSARGYMLQLFPPGLLYDAALFCALATAAGAVILGGVSGGYLWFTKKGGHLSKTTKALRH